VQIDVCALLNDTTGCLMSCAWKEDKCRIGLIIGTGTNACYLENIDAIKTVDASDSNGEDHMIINTEWG
jgi:hexokinase